MRAPRKSLAPETRARPKRASLFCSEIYRVSAERNGKRRAERGDVVRLPERLRLALPGDPVVVPEGPRRPGSRRRGGRRSGSGCATVPHPRPSHCPLLPATTQPKLERRRRHVPPPAHRRAGFCWGTVSWDDHGVRGVGPRRKQLCGNAEVLPLFQHSVSRPGGLATGGLGGAPDGSRGAHSLGTRGLGGVQGQQRPAPLSGWCLPHRWNSYRTKTRTAKAPRSA